MRPSHLRDALVCGIHPSALNLEAQQGDSQLITGPFLVIQTTAAAFFVAKNHMKDPSQIWLTHGWMINHSSFGALKPCPTWLRYETSFWLLKAIHDSECKKLMEDHHLVHVSDDLSSTTWMMWDTPMSSETSKL